MLKPRSESPVRNSVLVGSALAIGALFAIAAAQPPAKSEVVSVAVDKPGAPISPTLFGIFFEDINFAADGGLYPERVKNRSFEFTEPLSGWTKLEMGGAEGELDVRTDHPLNENNPHYLRLKVYRPGSGSGSGYGVENTGFRGIGVKGGASYTFSAYVRANANGPQTLHAVLVNEDGATVGEAKLSGFTGEWRKYEASLQASATSANSHLNVFATETGAVDVDMVSLYPKDTFRNRPNGLRPDLAQLLADMKPGFMRFPGGCIVEGRRIPLRYQWKKTVGDVSERRTIINRWNNEFDHRPTPDYFQSFGLGFYEYFQLAEDIGASPLPILNCGMACQFNSSETAPLEQTDEYIQDALDLIEFANGPTTSGWGSLRARMGHPAPFHLKMIGVGNEQWGPRYLERYPRFSAAIKAKYPEVKLIASAGPAPAGEVFDNLWATLRKMHADIIDEHYYMPSGWFLHNVGRYDHYDRSGPKVFAGEYAVQTSGIARPDNRNNWQGALAEGAYMTGLERNGDVVAMASYAPLFAHAKAWQWTPDLIWYDNLTSYGTPNYYVQKVFANNVGTRILPVEINGSLDNAQNGLYVSASMDEHTHELVLKLVNSTGQQRQIEAKFSGISALRDGSSTVLASGDLKSENSFEHPFGVKPVAGNISASGAQTQTELAAYSVTVLRFSYRP